MRHGLLQQVQPFRVRSLVGQGGDANQRPQRRHPLAGIAALRQLLQLGGGGGVGPVAQRTDARLVALRIPVGNRRVDDLQGRGPADPPKRGQQGRLVVFRKLGQGGQQRLRPLDCVLVPVTDDHDGLFRGLTFGARLGFQQALEHAGQPAREPANWASAVMAAMRTLASASSAAGKMPATLSLALRAASTAQQFTRIAGPPTSATRPRWPR